MTKFGASLFWKGPPRKKTKEEKLFNGIEEVRWIMKKRCQKTKNQITDKLYLLYHKYFSLYVATFNLGIQ